MKLHGSLRQVCQMTKEGNRENHFNSAIFALVNNCILVFNSFIMKLNGKAILFILVLIVVTAICKYFFGPEPGWSGFSPVIAIALFSGFILKERDRSFFLPLIALFISDAVIHVLYKSELFEYPGFYSGQWRNYLILLSATLIGWLLKGRSHASLLAGAIVAPTVFFLLSNFGV